MSMACMTQSPRTNQQQSEDILFISKQSAAQNSHARSFPLLKVDGARGGGAENLMDRTDGRTDGRKRLIKPVGRNERRKRRTRISE